MTNAKDRAIERNNILVKIEESETAQAEFWCDTTAETSIKIANEKGKRQKVFSTANRAINWNKVKAVLEAYGYTAKRRFGKLIVKW